MADSKPTTPLINTNMAKQDTTHQDSKPSGTASTALTSLAALKVILGISCIIAPRLAGRLFLLDIPRDAVLMARLFGSSCAGLGLVTWNLNRHVAFDEGALQSVVIANVLADVVDVVSCAAAYETGMICDGAFGMLGGGCVVLSVLGIMGFRGLSSD
ncbi:hypothetical protein PT974_07286 [Cladobotryum mycophilum]|uniref:MARVEL domain-containing protein n=1 Tax=Cladobotryum mycophilum TaxID=491253 RepID=A0ABR0SNU7_9HYPO